MHLVLGLVFLAAVSVHNLLFLGLNEKCKNGTEPWTCKVASSCKALKNGIEKDGEVKLCGFESREPVICCPPEPQEPEIADKLILQSTQPEGGKKAEEKCREYAKYVFREIDDRLGLPKIEIDECAIFDSTPSPLIAGIGGSDAARNAFPHMVLIGVEREGNSTFWFCGGSLISANFVLTAAHCFLRIEDQILVRLGELDITENGANSTSIDVKVAQRIDHPLYLPSEAYHDISLLKLEKEVDLGPSIRPVCLQRERNIDRAIPTATGWGLTSFGHNSITSNILQKVPIELGDEDKCVSFYGTYWPKVPKGIKTDIMICSGGVRGKDTCQGDSGGPLQIVLEKPYCMYSQIGITSFGIGCGSGTPGVYTRVSAYVPWIENIVWP